MGYPVGQLASHFHKKQNQLKNTQGMDLGFGEDGLDVLFPILPPNYN